MYTFVPRSLPRGRPCPRSHPRPPSSARGSSCGGSRSGGRGTWRKADSRRIEMNWIWGKILRQPTSIFRPKTQFHTSADQRSGSQLLNFLLLQLLQGEGRVVVCFFKVPANGGTTTPSPRTCGAESRETQRPQCLPATMLAARWDRESES